MVLLPRSPSPLPVMLLQSDMNCSPKPTRACSAQRLCWKLSSFWTSRFRIVAVNRDDGDASKTFRSLTMTSGLPTGERALDLSGQDSVVRSPQARRIAANIARLPELVREAQAGQTAYCNFAQAGLD